jgi:RNA recognition motif-containing protein
MPRKGIIMAKKIYVGNLSFRTDESELNELFAQYGEVVSARIITDRDTGRSRGFGFVEMSDEAQADEAIGALNNQEVGGRNLTVNEAKPRQGGDRPRPGLRSVIAINHDVYHGNENAHGMHCSYPHFIRLTLIHYIKNN